VDDDLCKIKNECVFSSQPADIYFKICVFMQCYEWPPQVRDRVLALQLLNRPKVLNRGFLSNGKFVVGNSNGSDKQY
jgi:hypothetical protein